MKNYVKITLFITLFIIIIAGYSFEGKTKEPSPGAKKTDFENDVEEMIEDGKKTFRFDTFGDEEFWGDKLKLHLAVAGEKNGGVGPGLSPAAALKLGLKVDSEALPQPLIENLKRKKINLNDPAVTLQLLKINAVIGLTGFFNREGELTKIGIQCALCHSTVDDLITQGIGRRRDGWANRDLNVGAIVALSPDLSPFASLLSVDEETVKKVLTSWGPGKFDAELILDGKAFRPDGKPAATLIPPAFGLAGVNLHTWTGWGSVPYWNAFVAVLEMHGKGTLFDTRLDDTTKFPIAAANGFGHMTSEPDLVTPKLSNLHYYQLSLKSPEPPSGSFDKEAAERGDELFNGKAKCASCHTEELYTEPGWNLHAADEICVDDFQSGRSPDNKYRTSPLKGVWTHEKGGFFHDGRFAALSDVINHYDTCFTLGLTDQEKSDLVEYLRSL